MKKINPKFPQVWKDISTYLRELTKPRSPNTIKSYCQTAERMLKYIQKPAKEVTYKDIFKYKDHLATRTTQRRKKHYSNSYRNLYSAINVFCKVYKIKDRNGQFLRLTPPEAIEPEKERVSLTREEVDTLFEASKDDKRNYAMFRVFVEAGVRVSELQHLNIDDVNTTEIDGRTIYYLQIGNRDFKPKAGSYRKSIITKETYDAIQDYIAIRTPLDDMYNYTERLEEQEKRLEKAIANNNLRQKKASQSMISLLNRNHRKSIESHKAVFHNIYNKRIGFTDIRQTIEEYSIKCKFTKRVTPHVFRHTCVNLMKSSGKAPDQIKLQTGHKSTKALDIYGNLRFQQQVEVFDDVFKKKDTEFQQKQQQEPKQQPQQQIDKSKDTETLLIERLAKGEITSEAFATAVVMLKKKQQPDIDYHQ